MYEDIFQLHTPIKASEIESIISGDNIKDVQYDPLKTAAAESPKIHRMDPLLAE